MNRRNAFGRIALAVIFLFVGLVSFGQQPSDNNSDYDNRALWAPFFYTQNGNEYRSADGTPGPKYWQNRVNYHIRATLDTTTKKIDATVEIDYTNNSPDQLSFLWLQLDQNIYKKDSRGTATQDVSGGRFANRKFTNGFEMNSVQINGAPADYLVNDTRMQIRLKNPLAANGGSTKIVIHYTFTIPQYGTDRMGMLNMKDGRVYEIAQWYPRMCVYDDVEGWNTLPYMGAGEFYLEYGDIDYEITLPSSMLVVGAGELMNPKDVLTKEERKRLKEASESDKTVMIRTQKEVENPAPRASKGDITWKFHMSDTRDVAWAASDAYIWDAARINLPDGKTALAQSVYTKESAGNDAWGRSTEYTKASIERYSEKWYPFPYKVATNVAGIVHGMEYPGFVFCSYDSKGSGLWNVTTHEFGHTWFPMIVGSNERKYAWMDEGINTFLNDEATEWFNKGEYFTPSNNQSMAGRTFSDAMDPLFTVPEVIKSYSLGVTAYYKPALALHTLRDVVLGKDRFDYALRKYAEAWAFKHPTPWDFFHVMENASGEDLAWFWRPWFFTNDKLDQSIKSVTYKDENPAEGALITLENLGEMALPAIIQVVESNGKDSTFTLPVEIWQRGGEWTFLYPSVSKLKSVTLDPKKVLPDINSGNNTWIEKVQKPIPQGISANTVIDHYINAIGGASNLDKIKDLTVVSSGMIQGQTVEYTRSYIVPDYFKMIISVPDMGQDVSKVVAKGDDIKVEQMGNEVPLNEEMKENIKEGSHLFPERNYLDSSYRLSLEYITTVDGEDAYKMDVKNKNGESKTVYFGVDSGLKLKEVDEEEGNNGQAEKSTTTYSDYREKDGIKFPYKVSSDGAFGATIDMEVKDLKINSGLDKASF